MYQLHKKNEDLFLLANMDETNWKIAYPGAMTWAKKGATEVKVHVNYNEKESLTAIATVTADESITKLPLTIIAKGKTDTCHKQLGEHLGFKYDILHSKSGWSNARLMIEYLGILRRNYDEIFADNPKYTIGETWIDLIWDSYSAHRDKEVESAARGLKINLYFIPPGATDQYQPLDIKVFGALKSMARKAWTQRYMENPDAPQDKGSAVQILLTTWNDIHADVVISAWNQYKLEKEQAQNDEGHINEDFEEQTAVLAKKHHTSAFFTPHNQQRRS
jgi:hypothetical protein